MLADRWAPRGLWSGLAVVSVGGLYLGVPETDHFVALAAGLAVLWLADVAGRARVDGLVVLALTAVVAWAGLWGAVSRPGAVTGALALLGLLLVAWVAELLPGPSQPIVPRQLQSVALLALQAVFAVAVARWGALRTAALEGAVVGGVGLLALAWLSRLVMGPRPW